MGFSCQKHSVFTRLQSTENYLTFPATASPRVLFTGLPITIIDFKARIIEILMKIY